LGIKKKIEILQLITAIILKKLDANGMIFFIKNLKFFLNEKRFLFEISILNIRNINFNNINTIKKSKIFSKLNDNPKNNNINIPE
jgi:hypothetical protein